MAVQARAATPIRVRPPRPVPGLVSLPYTGMRDSPDPSAADPRKAYLLQNVYPGVTRFGEGIWGRGGLQVLGAQGGSSGARRTQRHYDFVKADQTRYRVRFVGGVMQTLDWNTRTWTTVAYSGGVAVDSSARIFVLTFTDQLVVTDGVNKPWMWDGSTFTLLTNWPVVYGPMTIYYAKLFGIKSADRKTFVWCEENQPNTGMEAGGYNNAWDFVQTSADALTLLLGTNDYLYVYRTKATEYVTGEVSDNFKSTGTRSGISETIGTSSPFAVLVGQKVFTLDSDGHPQVMTIGGGYEEVAPIWQDAQQTLRRVPLDKLDKACACYYSRSNLVLYGIAGLGADDPNQVIVYDGTRAEFVGVWRWGRGETFASLDTITAADKTTTLLHGSLDGYTYEHGDPEGSLWDDQLVSGTLPITHIVDGTPIGYDVAEEKTFSEIHASFRLKGTLADMKLNYVTPYGTAAEQTFELTGGGFSVWGGTTWGGSVWSSSMQERHGVVGVDATGRWIRPRVRHSGLGEQFGFLGFRIVGSYSGSPNEAR